MTERSSSRVRGCSPSRSGPASGAWRSPWARAARMIAFLGAGMATGIGAAACSGADAGEAGESDPPESALQESPVVLITGSTGGLGREVALEMGSRGAHVIVHGRNEERGREVVDEIKAGGSGSAEFHRADLASFDEVRALAERILADHDRLDVLVHNAGIWLEPEDGRVLSDDGHELHFQVNYLSHFLLTESLLPLLRASGSAESPSRIIHVSSAAQRPIDFDDVRMDEGYSDGRGYAQSKLAQILHTVDLAEMHEGDPILAMALHPATMMDTDMVLSRGAQARASVDEGRQAVVNLITAPDPESGQYFNGQTPARANDQAYDPEARARLRALSLEWTGLR